MTKPNSTTDINDAISAGDEAADQQAGGATAETEKTRSQLYNTNAAVDAAIRKQQSGGSGTP
jgi:hypothetical protein